MFRETIVTFASASQRLIPPPRPSVRKLIVPIVVSSSIPVAAAQAVEFAAFASPLSAALRPVLFAGQTLMLIRIVLSWFPEVKETDVPWLFAYLPTEPLLKPTRNVIPPAFGVDISPVIWLALFSFAGEILVGPQGILNLIQRSSVA